MRISVGASLIFVVVTMYGMEQGGPEVGQSVPTTLTREQVGKGALVVDVGTDSEKELPIHSLMRWQPEDFKDLRPQGQYGLLINNVQENLDYSAQVCLAVKIVALAIGAYVQKGNITEDELESARRIKNEAARHEQSLGQASIEKSSMTNLNASAQDISDHAAKLSMLMGRVWMFLLAESILKDQKNIPEKVPETVKQEVELVGKTIDRFLVICASEQGQKTPGIKK